MKKIIAILAALTLCMSVALPVAAATNEFMPSVSNKPAPEIVPVENPDGGEGIAVLYDDDGQIIGYVDEGCLVITAVADAETSTEIPEDARDLLLDLYEKLTSGEMTLPYEKVDPDMNSGNMVIRDLFDASWLCEDHPELLEQDGTTMEISFDLNVENGVDVVCMVYVDGEWEPVVCVNNGDGTVTCTFDEICPIAFAVETENDPSAGTGDDSGSDLLLWGCIAVVALAAIIVLIVVDSRSKAKKA